MRVLGSALFLVLAAAAASPAAGLGQSPAANLVSVSASAAGAQDLSATAVPQADRTSSPPPPFLPSTLHLLGSYGLSPLHLDWDDLYWLAPSVAVSWITLHNDLPIYRTLALGDARKAWLDHSMPTVSAMGDGLTEAGLVAVASQLGSPRLARTSVVAMQALVISGVYGEALKFAAWSNRPYENDSGHYFWDFGQPTQGMPSGHSFSAFAVAEVYGDEYGREWTYPVAALIAYSRVYNQDHWPSDVVVGSLLGIIAGVQARHAASLFGVPGLSFGVGDAQGTPQVVAHARF